MIVTVDEQRGFAVFDRLLALWQSRQFPFEKGKALLPQEKIPADIREDESLMARFFFFACIYMRGGITSSTAFSGLIAVYRDDPGMFKAQIAKDYSHETVKQKLSDRLGNWDIEVAAFNWRENARRLFENWGGDVLNIFRGIDTYEQALERIRNKKGKNSNGTDQGFVGFQFKMTSMLSYFMVDAGLATFFPFPPPVDFHHLRILFGHRILEVETERSIRYADRILEPARALLIKYLTVRHANAPGTNLALADALWLFSLRLCSEAPGNTTPGNDGGRETLSKTKGKSTQTQLELGYQISPEEWRRNKTKSYLRSCGRCGIRETCSFFVPAQAYYRRGVLELSPHTPLTFPALKIPPTTEVMQTELLPPQLELKT